LDNGDIILSYDLSKIELLNKDGIKVLLNTEITSWISQMIQISKNKIAIIGYKVFIYDIEENILSECGEFKPNNIFGILPDGKLAIYLWENDSDEVNILNPITCKIEHIIKLEKIKGVHIIHFYLKYSKCLTILKDGRLCIPLKNGEIHIIR